MNERAEDAETVEDRLVGVPSFSVRTELQSIEAALQGLRVELADVEQHSGLNLPRALAPSIAVLPFVNIGGDKDNDYFSDGITEELINALANVDGLRVVSRTEVFALKGRNLDVTFARESRR